MPKGGARTRSGPPPDPNALARERDGKDWVTLPETGRQGPTPEWPLIRPTAREKELWAQLWTMPQAIMWEHHRQHLEVALYARKFIEAAQPKARANLTTAVRQIADSLGLTVPGLLRNKWRIGKPSAEDVTRAPRVKRSTRSRFTVVDGTG